MLDKKLLWTGGAITFVMMVAVVAAALPVRQEALPSQEYVSDVEQPGGPEEPEYLYLLREYEGRIGVFTAGAEEPELVLDVMVKHLPEYDKQLLQSGIPARSYGELVALMEDYGS